MVVNKDKIEIFYNILNELLYYNEINDFHINKIIKKYNGSNITDEILNYYKNILYINHIIINNVWYNDNINFSNYYVSIINYDNIKKEIRKIKLQYIFND